MTGTNTYDRKTTALLCIDFYNDFLSEGGELWPWVKEMAEEVNLLNNLRTIVRTARGLGITVYHVPHHRWEPGDNVNWKYPSPYQLGATERQAFAKDTWGGTFQLEALETDQVERLAMFLTPIRPPLRDRKFAFEPSVPRHEKWSMPSSSDQTRVVEH